MDLDLGVVEKRLGPARVSPAAGRRAHERPRDELPAEPPHRRDRGIRLAAQPLAELALIGETRHARELPGQRLVVEPLRIGQARPATEKRIRQLCDDEFRAVTVRGARARIKPGQRAQFLPQAELLGQRFQRGQPAERGELFRGDELEAQLGGAFGR